MDNGEHEQPGAADTPSSGLRGFLNRHPAYPYVIPFAVFLLLLMVQDSLAVLGRWEFPARVAVLTAVLLVFSRHVISFRVSHGFGSLAVGVGVFALWIAPDLLFPGYRTHWLFQNSLTGTLTSSIDRGLLGDPLVLVFRTLRAVVLVAIIEELFWRAWLLRWLTAPDFTKLPMGSASRSAIWLSALLFASEHGPYWDVGLLTGLIYNWWMVRTRSLGDCILMHGVTNACLSAFVMATGRWEYWL